MQLDASLSWLALGLTPGLASRLSARVLRRFQSPDGVFRASLPDLESCRLPAQVAQSIVKKEAFKRAEKELAGIQKIAGCSLVNWSAPEYPQALLQIYDPPVLLYVRGDPQVLNLPSLSIVGTRRPTLYGTQMARRLGRELAARGLVVVSGMARGIDAIGHQGAMDANGRAIGVLGTGIDVCYPKENKKLYEKVLERGAINQRISATHASCAREFSGARPHRCRNAARRRSGRRSAIQRVADYGASRNGVWKRSVRPGNVTQPVSFAPNQLIKQGAKLVTCAADVIEELPTPIRAALTQAEQPEAEQPEAEQPEAEQRNLLAAAALNSSEKKLYELLSADEPVHIDDIVERSGLNSSEVLATLFSLEMKGIVRQLPGKQFSKVLL